MTTPLVAQYRIDFPITVASETHHIRHYVKVTPGAGPSGYDGVLRDGTLGVDVTDLAEAFYDLWKPSFPSGTAVFSPPTLEQFSAGAWLPIINLATTAAPTGGGGFVTAGQVTISMRDTSFHRVRAIMMESSQGVGVRAVPGATGFIGTLINWYNGPIALTHTNGWNWVVGRSNLYVGGVLSFVTDLNDKLRRRRGIA